MTSSTGPLRVLIVDDSVFNRRSITEILSTSLDVEVVGKAADGEEALRLVSMLKPDVITLDLEMPRMDGFTFLRILMTKMPTPVIVVSSYSQKENVFKALELGALDFVAKPDRYADPDLAAIRDELLRKVTLARAVRLAPPTMARRIPDAPVQHSAPEARSPTIAIAPRLVIAIASSTGGPSALMEIFSRLPENAKFAVVIAQHMPDKFTRTFAERLDRRSALRVSEASDLDALSEGTAFVCPGKQCMELEMTPKGALRMRVKPPEERDRYVPSADRLLTSVAQAVGKKTIGVILTGMGDDGVAGARAIIDAGGIVVAEAESTAVVYGMPGAAVRAGVASLTLPLHDIGEWIARL